MKQDPWFLEENCYLLRVRIQPLVDQLQFHDEMFGGFISAGSLFIRHPKL